MKIIAELNTSHFGKLQNAMDAIETLAELGADAVKFQSWKPTSLFTSTYLKENPIEHRMFEAFSLDRSELATLAECAHDLGLEFSSTPYSIEEVEDLVEIGADFVKIASMDFVTPSLLSAAASTNLPIVASTGMCSWEEIEKGVHFLRSECSSSVTVLHCTSLYPTPLDRSDLGNLRRLKDLARGFSVGFSDHTEDAYAAAAAVALGATVLEKHVSLDKSKPGFDNHMAQSAEQFGRYVRVVRDLSASINVEAFRPSPEEQMQALKMRRSAHAKYALKAGTFLEEAFFELKRPGDGISAESLSTLSGRRLKNPLVQGQKLSLEDLEN